MKQQSQDSVTTQANGLCGDYMPPGSHDEMCANGEVRSHWQYLMRALGDMGITELQRRREEAWRQIRENDVTYNIYGDPAGMGRPWKLDLVPLLIGSEEWRSIETGLMQRAQLLNMVLLDLYGSRKLVKSGLLPPEIIYAHPGFLFPCSNPESASTHALTFYAADLARDADGQINVLSDRTQAPSGTGYALENRLVISRVLPSLFRDSHTHRLANFFRTTRKALNRLSPATDDEPNIVLLSPGPANEAYFEHAYLANYLGYTLVEGGDLTVRDNRVWLTTLEGLVPVDVILRRMDDSYCDPVELREDSFLGVPGLTSVIRTGKVGIANPLGSGILESPALHAFLPQLAKHLLGEELLIPSVTTWWCGHTKSCKHVLDNLEQMVIKPVHPAMGYRLRFGHEMSRQELELTRQQIKARPHLFVGETAIPISTVPVLEQEGLKPRHTVLRSFLVADEHDYMVMPGGLTRVSSRDDLLDVSSQAGGISKDTWVLATEPEQHVSLLSEQRQARLAPDRGGEVPGRVADNMFWLGRYTERAEFNVRLLKLALQFLETGEGSDTPALQQLLVAVTHQTKTYPGFTAIPSDNIRSTEEELHAVINSVDKSGSLAQTLGAMLRSARSVRDRLSSDTWRVINIIDEEISALGEITPNYLIDALDELDNLTTALTAFSGLTLENMTRGRSWRFLDTGRRLERALQLTYLLQSIVVSSKSELEQQLLLDSVLTISDSLMTYRRRYRQGLQTAPLLDLVICEENNPRSLAYQLSRIEEHVTGFPDKRESGSRSELERIALETATLVRLADVNRLASADEESGRNETLESFLQVLHSRLWTLSDTLTQAYFRSAEKPHQLVQLRSRAES